MNSACRFCVSTCHAVSLVEWLGALRRSGGPDMGSAPVYTTGRRGVSKGGETLATKDPAQVAAKWQSNLSNAATSIRNGVNAVATAPGQAAAAAQATMRARILEAIDSGKWAANVSSVSLASWKNSMLTTGLSRIADGASKGQPKVAAFMQQFLPYVSQVQQQVRAMPNATAADRKARMNANFDLLSQFTYRKQGS